MSLLIHHRLGRLFDLYYDSERKRQIMEDDIKSLKKYVFREKMKVTHGERVEARQKERNSG